MCIFSILHLNGSTFCEIGIVMKKERADRIEKISRLIEGGFDGTIGSEKHHDEIQKDLRDKNFGNSSSVGHEESYYSTESFIEEVGAGKDGYRRDSLLPYSTEGMLDEDIHVYILDNKFFGNTGDRKYRAAAIDAISFIFSPIIGIVSVQIGDKEEKAGGLRAKGDYSISKNILMSNISKIIDDRGNFLKEEGLFRTAKPSSEKLSRLNILKNIYSSSMDYLVEGDAVRNIYNLEKKIKEYLSSSEKLSEDSEEYESELKELNESLEVEKKKLENNDEALSESFFSDEDYLSGDQIYFLEHLLKSLEKSKLPFFLYIYDPIGGEQISFNGIKHDAIHIMNDKRSSDKENVTDLENLGSLKKYDSSNRKSKHNPQAYHNMGRAYMSLYQSFMGGFGFAELMIRLLENSENIDFDSFSDKAGSVNLRSIFGKGSGHKSKMKHLVMDFIKKYIVVRYKNYVDKSPFIDQNWTSDRFQDLFQAIVFNTIAKGDLSLLSKNEKNSSENKKNRIIDFEVGSIDEFFSDLNRSLEVNISESSTVNGDSLQGKIIELLEITSNKINIIFYNFVNELNDGKVGSKLYNEKADRLLENDDKFSKVLNEEEYLEDMRFSQSAKNFIEDIKSRPKLDGLIRRRLRFISKGQDVVYCFIRLQAKI